MEKQVIANKAEDEKRLQKKQVKRQKEWQDRLRAFTEENDLKRDYTREHIKDYKVSTKLDKSDKIYANENKEVKDVRYIGKIDKRKIRRV